MTSTLEQRVAALESGELERLRGLAQRRLERLREAQAMVRELQAQMKAATAELADLQWAEWRAIEERDVALAERDEANAKLAKLATLPPKEASALAVLRELDANRCSVSAWPVFHVPTGDVEWRAQSGDLIATAASFHAALAALAEKLQ